MSRDPYSVQEAFKAGAAGESLLSLDDLADVSLEVTVEFGRAELNIANMLKLGRGSVVTLDHYQGEPLEIRANGRLIARGEVVVVNDHYGIRVTEIVAPEGWADE